MYLYISIPIYLFTYLPIRRSIDLYVYLSIYLSKIYRVNNTRTYEFQVVFNGDLGE